MRRILSFVVIIVAVYLVKESLFIIQEDNQAIITEFGKPVGGPIAKAGVHFKVPFTQKVVYVDKKILYWDGFPNEIPTKDKKYIRVDTTARWHIVDVLKFIQTVRNESGAIARLDTILDAATRDVISNHNLVEAVRNSNNIMEKVKTFATQAEDSADDEVTGEIEKVKIGREELQHMIVENADKELTQLGIKLVDVQLRRISYEKSVEKKVYERMISERQRIAQKIRSYGQGEKAKIEGRLERDLKKVESEAFKDAQIVRGKADAKAAQIYAKALSLDPEFYTFIKTMDSYKKTIGDKTKFLLSSESEYLKFFK